MKADTLRSAIKKVTVQTQARETTTFRGRKKMMNKATISATIGGEDVEVTIEKDGGSVNLIINDQIVLWVNGRGVYRVRYVAPIIPVDREPGDPDSGRIKLGE